eukprot:7428032-Alexandrium_andersonii.AAC.1
MPKGGCYHRRLRALINYPVCGFNLPLALGVGRGPRLNWLLRTVRGRREAPVSTFRSPLAGAVPTRTLMHQVLPPACSCNPSGSNKKTSASCRRPVPSVPSKSAMARQSARSVLD